MTVTFTLFHDPGEQNKRLKEAYVQFEYTMYDELKEEYVGIYKDHGNEKLKLESKNDHEMVASIRLPFGKITEALKNKIKYRHRSIK